MGPIDKNIIKKMCYLEVDEQTLQDVQNIMRDIIDKIIQLNIQEKEEFRHPWIKIQMSQGVSSEPKNILKIFPNKLGKFLLLPVIF